MCEAHAKDIEKAMCHSRYLRDKHSVVDSDKNSAKRSTVNKQLYDVTNIMRRYFRAAGT